MKKAIYSLYFLAGATLLFSCSTELEKRIQNLEKRVAELENKKGGEIVQPASLQEISAEEVNPDGKYPEFTFQEMEYDFGTINEGQMVNHTYEFTNTGEVPLVIKNASASCGCTVPEWPKEPIAPGGTGKIEVKFDTKGKPNQQTKTVTITANTNPTVTRLKLKGMVTPKDDGSKDPA